MPRHDRGYQRRHFLKPAKAMAPIVARAIAAVAIATRWPLVFISSILTADGGEVKGIGPGVDFGQAGKRAVSYS